MPRTRGYLIERKKRKIITIYIPRTEGYFSKEERKNERTKDNYKHCYLQYIINTIVLKIFQKSTGKTATALECEIKPTKKGNL